MLTSESRQYTVPGSHVQVGRSIPRKTNFLSRVHIDAAITAECGAEVGIQHFHGDIAFVFLVVRELHRGQAACADFSLDAIAVGDGFAQTVIHANS